MVDKIMLLLVRFYFTSNKILTRSKAQTYIFTKNYKNKLKFKKEEINKYVLNDYDLYDLDQYISLTLARKLERFSEIVTSYPAERYSNLNSYKKEIKDNANNLKNITGSVTSLEIGERYNQLIENGAAEKLILKTEKELRKSEGIDLAKAKASIIWISDNLEHLWE
jgi:hypothetical protein